MPSKITNSRYRVNGQEMARSPGSRRSEIAAAAVLRAIARNRDASERGNKADMSRPKGWLIDDMRHFSKSDRLSALFLQLAGIVTVDHLKEVAMNQAETATSSHRI